MSVRNSSNMCGDIFRVQAKDRSSQQPRNLFRHVKPLLSHETSVLKVGAHCIHEQFSAESEHLSSRETSLSPVRKYSPPCLNLRLILIPERLLYEYRAYLLISKRNFHRFLCAG